jgi:hypothetical protein
LLGSTATNFLGNVLADDMFGQPLMLKYHCASFAFMPYPRKTIFHPPKHVKTIISI